MATNCLIIAQYGMWMKAVNLRVVNIERESMRVKADRLIPIDNQARNKGKEATSQVRQPIGHKTEENGKTMIVGNERDKELMLVGNEGDKELIGSGENLKKNIRARDKL